MPNPRAQLLVALVSGASALIYQTIWLRWFRLLFGNTAYAASATLCAFFLGLALGAAIFGRAAGRSRRPLRLYAGIEAGVALSALVVPLVTALYEPIYATLYAALAESRPLFVAVKFALALAAMLPSATLIGGTFPPLAAAFVGAPGDLGRRGGLLYATNTLGAALGVVLGALVLPDLVGIPVTYGVALALSLTASASAFVLARHEHAEPLVVDGAPGRAPRRLLALSFGSGLGTIALEVLLIHALAQILNSSVYSYGAVLLVVLLALAAGAALVSASEGRIAARTLLGSALALEALLLWSVPVLLIVASGGLARHLSGSLVNGLLLAGTVGGPALLVGGLVLPLCFRLAAGGAGQGGNVGPRVGGLLAANTFGGVLGSLAASFVLLDGVGLWPSFAWVALLYAVGAVAAAPSARARAVLAGAVAAIAVATVAGPVSPARLPVVALEPGETLVAVEEGAHGVVSVVEREGHRWMKVDNFYSLESSATAPHARRAGHIPLLLHPAPKRVLFVGSATGGTASAAVEHALDEIVMVEIVPEVHALAAAHFADSNAGVHRDPRTRLVVEDGRNHLRAAPEQYDVVVADLFVPWRPGVGALYSREHFQAVRDHLTPGGVFAQWLPLYQLGEAQFMMVAATFLEVFPEATLWRGDFAPHRPAAALVGINGAAPTLAEVDARIRAQAARGLSDPWLADPRGFWMFHVGALADVAPDAPINTDAWPRFEYSAGRSSYAEREEFVRYGWPRLAERVIAAGGSPFANPPPPGPRGGADLARAMRLAFDGDTPELRPLLRELRREIPRALIAKPDTSLGEVWPFEASR